MRIVRLANCITPRSGGVRTTLRELEAGYLAAGHQPVLIVPGERDSDERTPAGRVITVRAPTIPLSGGYRLMLRKGHLTALLESAAAGPARGFRPHDAALDRALGAQARRARRDGVARELDILPRLMNAGDSSYYADGSSS